MFSVKLWIFNTNGQRMWKWQLLENRVSKSPLSWIPAILNVYCDKLVPSLSMVPNFHYYHCKYILNRIITLQSSCSDSHIQQTGSTQKEMAVVDLICLKQDFHWVFPKRVLEIVHFCRNNQAIQAFTLKGDMFIWFFQRKCVWGLSLKQLRHTVNIYFSYLQLIIMCDVEFSDTLSKTFGFYMFYIRSNWELISWLKRGGVD